MLSMLYSGTANLLPAFFSQDTKNSSVAETNASNTENTMQVSIDGLKDKLTKYCGKPDSWKELLKNSVTTDVNVLKSLLETLIKERHELEEKKSAVYDEGLKDTQMIIFASGGAGSAGAGLMSQCWSFISSLLTEEESAQNSKLNLVLGTGFLMFAIAGYTRWQVFQAKANDFQKRLDVLDEEVASLLVALKEVKPEVYDWYNATIKGQLLDETFDKINSTEKSEAVQAALQTIRR